MDESVQTDSPAMAIVADEDRPDVTTADNDSKTFLDQRPQVPTERRKKKNSLNKIKTNRTYSN